jgi:ABC-type nitrate/sulfonate/bicarbonate transport system ATPase subunit
MASPLPLGRESLRARSAPADEPSALRLRGVDKGYELGGARVEVLRGIDLEVSPREIVAIVGGSGSGKSTLLRVIAGLEARDRGSIDVGGRVVNGPERDCGMVFQEHRLFPWMNVAENVAFGVAELPPEERRRSVAEHIALVGLDGFEGAYPSQLSGGMSQRVALARALAPRPRVLLLDEPFASLDALTKVRMQHELLRIWSAEQATLLLVTHDVEEAVYLASRVVVLAGRPARVRRIIEVELERPRERTSAAFAELRREVLAELLDEAALVEAETGEQLAERDARICQPS